MKKSLARLLILCLLLAASPLSGQAETADARRDALRAAFLKEADQVIVTEESVIFPDATNRGPLTIPKNPKNVTVLYPSLTTLWYEAGGVAGGVIGGDSAVSLYQLCIGRDITRDAGVAIMANTAAGKNWSVEAILARQPDLILCSTAMSGYKTLAAPAQAAQIPILAVDYNDFADYLKWFKVFCNLSDHPELWEGVALPALSQVVDVLCRVPEGDAPRVLALFLASDDSLSANTSNTVLGGMITQLGGVNIADAPNGSADRVAINLESVYAGDPDYILVQCHAGSAEDQLSRAYGDNPVWQSLRAVREGRVAFLDPTLFHHKPNRRFAQAYLTLAKLLYPQIDFGEANSSLQ